MKNLFHFVIWFTLMAFVSLPIVWYLNSFFGLSYNIGEPLVLIAGSLFIILAVLSTEFFELVLFYFEWPFRMFRKIETYIENREVNKLRTKNYVRIKK